MGKPDQRPELGDRVKDKLSGFTGIVIGETTWIYGCRRLTVQSEDMKEGKPIDPYSFDAPQLEVLKKSVLAPRPVPDDAARPHGPRPDAARRDDPSRR